MTARTHYRDPELAFYTQQSNISSPGRHAALYDELPASIPDLCRVIQGLVIHQFWILDERNYGLSHETLKDAGRNLNDEINLRSTKEILSAILALDGRPLTEPRDPARRLVGNCRDYSLLLVSILRHRGIPARVRSGVARYFFPDNGHLEDHFICEWWNEGDQRWQRTDAQIDEVQYRVLGTAIDMTDLPAGQFLDAGESYDELESGLVTPERIGIMEDLGWPYVNYKLVSDLACVNRVEVLAWEGWGICERMQDLPIETNALSDLDIALLEKVAAVLAALTTEPARFADAREIYENNPDLKLPQDYEPFYFELPPFK